MNIRPKTTVVQRISGAALSHSQTRLATRDLVYVSDEPLERGGTNQGFAPTELLLSALVACTNVITHKLAAKNDIEIRAMDIRLDAQFDRRGVTLEHDVEVPYPSMTLIIDLTTSASDEQIELLKSELPRFCAVSKVIQQSGTKIDTQWNISR